jgi:uncharacterized protein YdaU (DUF1376 family)
MPFYVGDYRRDTGHLGTLEHGAYLLLIMHYWECGPLPDDEMLLRRITLLSAKQWHCVWPTLKPFFMLEYHTSSARNGQTWEANAKQVLSNCWHHKRVDAELEKYEMLKAKRQIAGSIGGLKSRGRSNLSRHIGQAIAKQTGHHSPSKIKDPSFAEPRARAETPPEAPTPPSQNRVASPALEAAVQKKGWSQPDKESGLPRKEGKRASGLGDRRSLEQIVRDKGWAAPSTDEAASADGPPSEVAAVSR